MDKKNGKKILNFKGLIADKEAILKKKENVTKTVHINRLDADIIITKPDTALITDTSEMGGLESNNFLVYQCVIEPNLKEKELHEAYECVEPLEIVEKIFEPGEVYNIAQEIIKLAGYGNTIKALKN